MIRIFKRTTFLFTAVLLLISLSHVAQSISSTVASQPDTKFQKVQVLSRNGASEHAIVVSREASDLRIRIDGSVDEPIWRSVTPHETFYVIDPDTLEPASLSSAWRLFYTDRGLYVSAVCEQAQETLVERLSARDLGFLNRDYVSFVLDTSGEARYGYWFQLNLGGSRSDGTIQPERKFSDNWDGAWYGETARTTDGWSAEFFIPWSIVSMPRVEGQRQMGIIMQRRIAYRDERYAYPALPFTKPKFLSAFQKLALEGVNPRQRLSFFPQISSTYDAMDESASGQAGLDVFWRPSTNLQLTATAKPDFGTVEADSVIINLSATETFFPEKRLFFLEGQEIFTPTGSASSFGGSSTTLLHTRRIGQRPFRPTLPDGVQFESEQFNKPADLLGATKATGQVGSLRYGVLAAFEDDSTFYGQLGDERVTLEQPGRDFGVVRALWERSHGDYRGLGFMSTHLNHPTLVANAHSLDGHYFSESGKIRLQSQFFMSDIPSIDSGYGGTLELDYAPRQGVTHEFEFKSYDERLNLNYTGYLARNDINKLDYEFRIRKNTERYRESDTRFDLEHALNGTDQVINSSLRLSQEFTFNNNTRFRVRARYRQGTYDDRNSFGDGTFYRAATSQFEVRYSSDSSQRFYYNVSTQYATESLEGGNVAAGTFLIWRPSNRMTMHTSLFYNNRDSWLLYQGDRRFTSFGTESWSPRLGMDLFMTAKQHLRFDLEWHAIKALGHAFYTLPTDDTRLAQTDSPHNGMANDFAISRLNMQIRYRWELAPMSDLFVVYSKRASLPNALAYGFSDQFAQTLSHPLSEGVVFKLRHHLGT